jgi:hypothetical protein
MLTGFFEESQYYSKKETFKKCDVSKQVRSSKQMDNILMVVGLSREKEDKSCIQQSRLTSEHNSLYFIFAPFQAVVNAACH